GDVALLDAKGRLQIFANERSGQFVPWPVNPPNERFVALGVADANEDAVLDIIALRDDGVLLRISDRDKRQGLTTAELGRWQEFPKSTESGAWRLFAADLDNNGAIDILATGPAGSQLWLGAGNGNYQLCKVSLPANIVAAEDLDGTGRLDLLALTKDGKL